MVSTLFRDPQARSSALGMLQPRAFGSLNRVEILDSSSNYYLVPHYLYFCSCQARLVLNFFLLQMEKCGGKLVLLA